MKVGRVPHALLYVELITENVLVNYISSESHMSSKRASLCDRIVGKLQTRPPVFQHHLTHCTAQQQCCRSDRLWSVSTCKSEECRRFPHCSDTVEVPQCVASGSADTGPRQAPDRDSELAAARRDVVARLPTVIHKQLSCWSRMMSHS
jgi:hypothetical protein